VNNPVVEHIRARNTFLRVALISLVWSAVAHAQSNPAQAEQLFRDGKDLMAKREYAEACKRFEASDKADPAITTKANLADCREKNGQISTAWGLYLEVARLVRDDPKQAALARKAKESAQRLEPRLSFLIINVRDEAKIEGLEIFQNGHPVDSLTWNSSLPVDGGDYRIEGKAPGFEAWATMVHVAAERDKQSVDVPKFKGRGGEVPEPGPVRTARAPGQTPVTEEPRDGAPRDAPGGLSGKRKLAIGLAALGVGGVATSVVFEVSARSSYRDAKAAPELARRTDLTNQANRKRGIAIGTGVVGVAALGVSTYLWLTGAAAPGGAADRTVSVVPALGRDSVGLSISGRM